MKIDIKEFFSKKRLGAEDLVQDGETAKCKFSLLREGKKINLVIERVQASGLGVEASIEVSTVSNGEGKSIVFTGYSYNDSDGVFGRIEKVKYDIDFRKDFFIVKAINDITGFQDGRRHDEHLKWFKIYGYDLGKRITVSGDINKFNESQINRLANVRGGHELITAGEMLEIART